MAKTALETDRARIAAETQVFLSKEGKIEELPYLASETLLIKLRKDSRDTIKFGKALRASRNAFVINSKKNAERAAREARRDSEAAG